MDLTRKAGIEDDLVKILLVQALRAFAYGFGTVILGTSLAQAGLTNAQVGLVFAAMLAGMAAAALVVGAVGERIGRRRLYGLLLALMGVAGTVFALTSSLVALVAAALTGTMSTDANESGPITSLEQAMIGQAPRETRVHVFGRYNAIAYLAGAGGALAAGAPDRFRGMVPALPADQRFLLLFPVLAAVCVLQAVRLSPAVEHGGAERPAKPLARSRANVVRLASLFAVDAFAGGFVVTTFIVFWFERRFGVSPRLMAAVVFATGLLQAGSSIVAARVGARIGLLNTMVFTHLPSNLLLALVPIVPSLGWAIAVLLARSALSQMDVPTRQAYLAAMVDPEERTAAAAFTNTSRYVARPLGPVIGGALMGTVGLGAPFVVAGALKSVYDLVLWRVFRRVRLPD
ncbi:MAG: MFS transporter [Actinobacteria bacterium]|nr:MFS transporter [Actinomycetota bacterium]